MSSTTSIKLRDLFFYQIFPRQFSETHDLKGVTRKLDALKAMRVDVLHLLPIYPIGIKNRKGTMGSPYSIADYCQISPDLGTIDDFKNLLSEAHKRGLKLIIDIVFNHTSHDATYTLTHPEWYYHKADGSLANRVGDWWDIADLKFEGNPELEDELIRVLKHWTGIGVDGFRCDVAPLLPLPFWKRAHDELVKMNPELIFLSESVHLGFIKSLRDQGFEASSDSEIYQVFDICYDYDIYDEFIQYFKRGDSIRKWVDALLRQEGTYPKNYVKLRFLENHDQERLAKFVKTEAQLRSVNTMLFFLKGCPLIYNGQECGAKVKPDLFEIDPIDWSTYDEAGLVAIYQKMMALRKELSFVNGVMNIKALNEHVLEFRYDIKGKTVVGIFNLSPKPQKITVSDEGIDYLTNEPILRGKYKLTESIVLVLKKGE